MLLENKTALITGGGSGIGAAIAVSLAKTGCRVAIAGRREEPLLEAAAWFVNGVGVAEAGFGWSLPRISFGAQTLFLRCRTN